MKNKVKKQVRKTKHTKARIVPLHTDRKEAEKAAPTVGASLPEPKRKTGIDILGEVGWGTHVCLFYHTGQDLIDILVPYFKAGLENNEFCMWVTSEPLNAEDAKRALKRAVKNLDGYIQKGQIEILDYSDWYTKTGDFEADRVLQGWIDKHDQAIKNGFDGLRLTGNTFWLEKEDWGKFTDYEAAVNNVIGKYKMLGICTYALERCGVSEIMDVEHNHQFVLLKWKGAWKILEGSDRNQMEARLAEQTMIAETLERGKKEWIETFNAISDWVVLMDLEGRIVRTNRAGEKFTGVSLDEIVWQSCCRLVHGSDEHIPGCPLQKMVETSQRASAELQVPDTDQWLRVTVDPITGDDGNLTGAVHVVSDITERKKAGNALQEKTYDLGERVKELNCLYGLSKLIDKRDSLEEIFQGIAELIPLSWQYPDLTCVRILALDSTFESPNFRQTEWNQAAEIKVHDRSVGRVEVFYTEKCPEEDEGPFLEEERDLIDILAGRLGKIIERKRTDEALRKSERQASAAIEASKGITFNYDIATGKIEWGGTIKKVIEYTPKEFAQVDIDGWAEMIHPDDKDRVLSILQEAIQKKDRATAEYRFRTKRGGYVILSSISLTEKKDGKAVRLVGILHDITERKQAEEALRNREEKLRTIIDHSHEVYFLHDTKHRLTYVSPNCIELFGHTAKQMTVKWTTLVTDNPINEEGFELTEKAIRTGKRQKPYLLEVKRKDGELRWVEIDESPVKDANGKVIAISGALQDITERKKAEEALRESEEKHRTLLENIPQKIFYKDTDSVYISCNENYARDLGIESDNIAGKTDYDFYPKELAEKYIADDKRVVDSGQTEDLEESYIQDGKEFIVHTVKTPVIDEEGNIIGIQGIFWDITERKKAEEELRKTQEATQQFNEKLRILHEVTNKLTKAKSSDEVCRLAVELGRKKLGFPRIGIWLKGSDPEYTCGTFGIDENGNICDDREVAYKVKDLKETFWKSVFYEHEEMIIEHDCQLQDARGKAVGKGSRVAVRIWDGKNSIGIIFVDDLLEPGAITDRQIMIIKSFASTVGHLYSQKRAEEEIDLFARTVAEKNRELESIMNITAHDLRTPLVNIKGFGDLLQGNLQHLRSMVNQSKVPDNLKNELETIFTEDIYQNLKFIKMGTEMLDSLLKALLRLARLGRAAVDFQKLNMNEMISDITGSIKYHLDTKNVKLTIKPLPDCYGDKAMVAEVFLNLLGNAVKYLDPSRPGLITLSGSKKKDRVIYCVRDNGFGIDPEPQKHVFDIFYRIRHGEQHVDGEGMGLTIVRRIMDFHDGKVWLESEKGIGSKFYVSFPAAEKPLSKRILEIKKGIVPEGTIPRQESYR